VCTTTTLYAESQGDVLVFDMTLETLFLERMELICPLAQRMLTAPVWESTKLVLAGHRLRVVLDVAETFAAPFPKHPAPTYYVVGGDADPGHPLASKLEAIFSASGEHLTSWPVPSASLTIFNVWTDESKRCPFQVSTVPCADIRGALRQANIQLVYDGKLLYATRSALDGLKTGVHARPKGPEASSLPPALPLSEVPRFVDLDTLDAFFASFVGSVYIALPLTWFQVPGGRIRAFVDASLADHLTTAFRYVAPGAGFVSVNLYGATLDVELAPADRDRAIASSSLHRRIHLVFTRASLGDTVIVTIQDPVEFKAAAMPDEEAMAEVVEPVFCDGGAGVCTISLSAHWVRPIASGLGLLLKPGEQARLQTALGALHSLVQDASGAVAIDAHPLDVLCAIATHASDKTVTLLFSRWATGAELRCEAVTRGAPVPPWRLKDLVTYSVLVSRAAFDAATSTLTMDLDILEAVKIRQVFASSVLKLELFPPLARVALKLSGCSDRIQADSEGKEVALTVQEGPGGLLYISAQ